MQVPNPQSMDEVVLQEDIAVEGGIIVKITINRPAKLNALNADVVSGLKQVCANLETRDDVRCVIFTGAKPLPPEEGKRPKPNAFVAGADISEFLGKNSVEITEIFTDNAWEAIWNLSKPTIAMVDGFALGGGLEVACSCDIRVASERSKFATPEINLGLIPGGGGTQRLSHLIGYGRAMEMVMTGEMISAQEAHRIGLVNHLCSEEELEEKTMVIAKNIASKSSSTMKVAKQVVRAALDNPISTGIAIEAQAFANLFDTEDKEVGVQAFLNREKPEWKHR